MEPKGVLAKHARVLLAGFLRPSPASSFFVELPASSSVSKFSSPMVLSFFKRFIESNQSFVLMAIVRIEEGAEKEKVNIGK